MSNNKQLNLHIMKEFIMKKLYLSYEFRRRMEIAAGLYPGKSTKNDFIIKVNGVNHTVRFYWDPLMEIDGPNAKMLENALKREFNEINIGFLGCEQLDENTYYKPTFELSPKH